MWQKHEIEYTLKIVDDSYIMFSCWKKFEAVFNLWEKTDQKQHSGRNENDISLF